jgi:AraC-like DNA-binding protein
VDVLTRLLKGPRAQDAFVLRVVMDPGWAIRVEDRAPLTITAMLAGSAVAVPDGGAPIALTAGDVAVFRGPEPYLLADEPGSPITSVIQPGQLCIAPDGVDLKQRMRRGVRMWGTATGEPATDMLIGTYESVGEVGQRLLDALPPLLALPGAAVDSPLVDLLLREAMRDAPGQEVVLDRLVDLTLVATLRAWLAGGGREVPGWYRHDDDPIVGPALDAMVERPGEPWTVASLAREIGVSRATLARRFTDLVGEPPMAFLTDWRLTLASDLLLQPDSTVGGVAQRVGYGSAFALSAAFKRVRGISPSAHRAAARAAEHAAGGVSAAV